jgi:outer membrane receptor protein involved in Fe transport
MSEMRVTAGLGRKSRMAIAIMAALGGSQTVVYAQDPAVDTGDEITVTGSRLRTSGMDMPNPVTVVTQEEISIIAPTNLIEGLSELPQFYLSSTTQSPSGFFTSDGAGSLNLRGLNSKRTLQLLDGRRVVQSTIFGGPDINLFPANVIRSIETVTGGATAAYGTDAVAGVVNFILDTNFEGFRANASTGANENGDGEHYEAAFAAGFALGENTHVLVSLEKNEQDPIWGDEIYDYDWYQARALVNNPAAGAGSSRENPFYVAVSDVYSSDYSLDGIFHLPASAGGDQILNATGTPSPFVQGSPCGVAQGEVMGCSTTNGGSGVESGVDTYQISPDTGRETLFGYVEHEFGNLNIYGQAISSEAEFTSANFGGLFGNPPAAGADRNFVIYSGNPFLPPSIQAAMTNNVVNGVPTPLPSVQFSRIGAVEDLAFDAFTQQITETDSLTGGFEYEFQGDGFFGNGGWQLEGYYQSGETDVRAIQRGGIRLDRIYLAVDVVNTPAGPRCNVSVVSAANGNPIYQDCVPLNLFGRGRASPAAIDWVTGFEPGVQMNAQGFLSATASMPHSYVSDANKKRIIDIEQDVWEVSADGQIADGWAGPITMAFGYGFREESFTQVVEVGPGGNVNADPRFRPVMASAPQNPTNTALYGIRSVPGGALASGNSVEIQFSNVPFARGEQDVKEAFAEFLIPLINDRTGAQQLNFSAAARWADYSGAGQVQSWKGGFDWAIVDSVRVRATVSQDVRAATMGEKFDRTGGITPNFNDLGIPNTPTTNSPYSATQYSNGTPDIKPEVAKTKTFGVVYQPTEISGLSVSVDWYSIRVRDNIQQTTAQSVINGCYLENEPFLCSLITREGQVVNGVNQISLIGVPYYNQNAVEAKGIDFEVNYRKDVDWFGGGELVGMRFLGSWLDERNNISSTGAVTRLAGTCETTLTCGLPEWTALLQGNYNRGPLSAFLSVRYTDSMLYNRAWNFNGNSVRWDVADNEIASETIVDARFNYRFEMGGGNLDLFLNVNNLFDTDPEEALNVYSSNFSTGTGLGIYGESRGRRLSVGVNMDFGR